MSFLSRRKEKKYLKSIPRRMSTSVSDNQAYPHVCLEASYDYRKFSNFRRDPIYNEILEHVTEELGHEYLKHFSDNKEIMAKIEAFKENDQWGNPYTYDYPGVGKCSPSTLRYIKVLNDLRTHFGELDSFDICEIGVGYGGQCRVVNAWSKPATYRLVDIKPALLLAQRFLDNYVLNSVMSYKTMNELPKREYDLVVSNYAFTELPKPVQNAYLEKIVLNAKRGYITYNEVDIFPCYKVDELVAMLPGAQVLAETPLTSPKNCIIVWGHNG